ncbi:hypothetical protein [Nesterenkonia populi]|uniref:hypothetical protein n=1 Tax=Nesterenkonia populi TaxID=1591087 RepID=UPI0011BEE0A9|nr:hypothetical protein [Nesterenkonia populi]
MPRDDGEKQAAPHTLNGDSTPTAGVLRPPGRRRLSLGRVALIFTGCLTAVAAAAVFAAWILGGRAAGPPQDVQALIPPPEPAPETTAAFEFVEAQPGEGEAASDAPVKGEVAAVLPGARHSADISEIPVDSLTHLKSMGWAVPYMERTDLSAEYAETGVVEGVRTIRLHLSNGEHWINVSETRSEEEGRDLAPMKEKVAAVVDFDAVEQRELPLSTGQTGRLFLGEDSWTSGVEQPEVQYVISSDFPEERAAEITSWVLTTDRSRLQVMPYDPGAGDRLERGFDELVSWFGD